MADQTTAELIAEARRLARHSSVSVPEHANMLGRLADALEAVVQERDNWKMSAEEAERAEKRWKDRAHDYSTERDQLAAVVEKVRFVIERESGWFRYRAEQVSTVLASAPSDALRDVKADAIREYVEAARENPHTYYWPPSGVLDDAEQWAEEIEKGTI